MNISRLWSNLTTRSVKYEQGNISDMKQADAFKAVSALEEAANKVANKIWQTTRLLSDHPAIGKPGRVPGTREMVVSGTSYILPYRVAANEVQILRVLHGARKWPEKL